MFVFDPDTPVLTTDLFDTAQRLRSLADDLESYAHGVRPSDDDLRDAPLIDAYAPLIVPTAALVGLVTDHPLKPGRDRQIATSGLWAIDPSHGWARTLSRYYRLGRPRGAQQPQEVM
jgi:hypothetical protein